MLSDCHHLSYILVVIALFTNIWCFQNKSKKIERFLTVFKEVLRFLEAFRKNSSKDVWKLFFKTFGRFRILVDIFLRGVLKCFKASGNSKRILEVSNNYKIFMESGRDLEKPQPKGGFLKFIANGSLKKFWENIFKTGLEWTKFQISALESPEYTTHASNL